MSDPIKVLTISGTGDGRIADPVVATTPNHLPNVVVETISPLLFIFIRSLRVFLQSIIGLLGVVGTTNLIPAPDFYHALITCASLSMGAAVVCAIQNIIELLTKFDQTHPTLQG